MGIWIWSCGPVCEVELRRKTYPFFTHKEFNIMVMERKV